MTASLPTFTSLMDQARAAVAELDQALVDIDAKIDETLLEVDKLRARRREIVEQRRPIAAILPGGRPAKPPSKAGRYVAPEPSPCPHCGKLLKHPALHIGKCPKRTTAPVAAAPSADPPLVEQLATGPGPVKVTVSGQVDQVAAAEAVRAAVVAETARAFEAEVRRLFEMHHRESFTRRCQLTADALGKTTSQIRGVAQRLGLA